MSADRLNLMADELQTLSSIELAYVLRKVVNRLMVVEGWRLPTLSFLFR